MKRYIITAFISLFAAVTSFAALPTSGEWKGLNTGDISRRVSTQTVKLEGNVDLKCTIIVGDGVTLTIEANGAARNIFNKVGTSGRSGGMFEVEAGGKLIIKGESDDHRVIIGGGGNYATPTYNTTLMSGGIIDNADALHTTSGSTTIEMGAPAIENQGKVELNWVTIQNVCYSTTLATSGGNANNSGGAIRHGVNATSTKMSNCVVNRVLANTGTGVFAVANSDGEIVISDTEFKNCINYTTNIDLHGGVVRGWGTSKANITLNRVHIHHCYSAADAGAIYFPSNGTNNTTKQQAVLTLNGCEFNNNCSDVRSGALDVCANLEFKTATTKVHHNYVQRIPVKNDPAYVGIGGGISFRAYDSGSNPPNPVNVEYKANNLLEVYNNKSYRGGGIAFYASDHITLLATSTFKLNVSGAKIHDNEATGYGGGIWMRNDNDENNGRGYKFDLYLNSGKIYSNKAVYGGGLFVNKWDVSSSTSGTISIYKNSAVKNDDKEGGNGGAIYLQNTTYEMNSGTIGGASNGNTAENNAGGIYLTSGSVFKFNGGAVSYNTASNFGGGVLLTGSSKATFTGGDVKSNTAVSSGGGVAVFDGSTFNFSNGNVTSNSADDSGGGLYCTNATINFQNGECNGNSASVAGGGVSCVNGGTVTFTGNIKDNTARRGGGIALNSGASFTMKGGIISGNKAVYTATGATTTTYDARNNGFGGGICLYNTNSTGTKSLTVDVSGTTPFGLYGNEASIGGNDITSSGVRTSVTIPNVKSMELAGFAYKDASPNWYEDYNAADVNYDKGTKLDAATNARYADQLTANTYLKHLVSFSGNSHTYNNYLNLTLGYELLHIVIKAKNLLEGESAMFQLTYNQGTSTEKSWPVVLIGNGSEWVSRTVRNLNYGQYEAVPVSWQWNYEVDPESGYNENVTAGPEKIFEFILERKDLPLKTDEERVVNKM